MTEHHFESRQEAATAASARIVELLKTRLEHQPRASLVVSGGTTPVDCYAQLARAELDWDRVDILLSDERWVPSDHADSNERQAREALLTDKAAAATLVPVYADGVSPQERCDELQDPLPVLPFSCALVGMGTDGHFASLFPDADNLEFGLDPESGRLYVPIDTAASDYPRVSMSLAGISRSDEVALLIFGDEKLDIFNKSKEQTNGFPVSRLLRQKRAPVRVFWAP